MMADRFPDDLFEQIRQLAARVDHLEAQLRQRPGVTKASQGWLLADMSVPTVPSGHVQIGCASGDFYVATSDGEVKRMPGVGSSVVTPDVDLSDAPSSYNQTWAQAHVASTSSIYQSFLQLLDSLGGAGFIEF
ncbi:hypothetical protein FH608_046010 [Nonomuraea phyllanthi]|uniref:Uncharacterized protein n=1 Tax=Nonomuraea phyllanthi TaxID=2219224 RepID=A0A5C4V5N7_9ACTN|nr:hypothetical protein [Nonomuraea phyllanthi]KAB8186851.1 hypothetical protein FH608_046010 [Nonomuraea phyllanthi]